MECGFRAFRKKNFDVKAGLSVKFTDEEGMDAGGLTIEFLRLFLLELEESHMVFAGPDGCKVLAYNELCEYSNYYDKSVLIFFLPRHTSFYQSIENQLGPMDCV